MSLVKEEHKNLRVAPELVPEHFENIDYIINVAYESKLSLTEVDGIAPTAGPGLIVCLTVGLI